MVTYREVGNFLVSRVDQELTSASQNPALFFRTYFDPSSRSTNGVPPGTYAEFRDQTGALVQHTETYPGQAIPNLPDSIPAHADFTLDNPHYRVATAPATARTDAGPVDGTVIVAIPMRDVDDTLHHLLLIEILVATFVLIALAILAWWVVKLGLRPLEEMGETAGAIAAGDLSRRVEPADDLTEVGRLGLALNTMLGQIEGAFEERTASEVRLRRFVADASHELRTPLTSIRGYAELFRRGASERPEDLAKTMSRIEEAAARMGVLVEDLLLLARLDQGRPLELERVDLSHLVGAAVDDLRAAAPARPVFYESSGKVMVTADENRIRQVVANLLENARSHTPPDTPVEVRVSEDGNEALIEISDRGPGMSEEDAARAFERFYRADPSRARDSGGSGLGLAIVAAITAAHGGRAEVQTAPGEGATFRVWVPCEAAPQPEPDPEPATAFEALPEVEAEL
jgi:two-component system OmpR family sensor kinase